MGTVAARADALLVLGAEVGAEVGAEARIRARVRVGVGVRAVGLGS